MAINTIMGFTIRLVIAIILGFLIGFERQWNNHKAGILTNVIVCVGSFTFTAFAFLLDGQDLTRIAANVVTGIGFLGAGLILRDGANIRGINTAATVWATAGVGMLCCVNNIYYACIVAILIILSHTLFHPLSVKISQRHYLNNDEGDEETYYEINVKCESKAEEQIRNDITNAIKEKKDILLHSVESAHAKEDKIEIFITFSSIKSNDTLVEELITNIVHRDSVIATGWKKIDNEN